MGNKVVEWLSAATTSSQEVTNDILLMNFRFVIVGDAFCTLKQESLISVITQAEEISGPPKYLTADWWAAKNQ